MGDDLETVKSIIRRVLLANKGLLPCDKFLGEYKRCSGESLEVSSYGFTHIRQFLESLSDVVHVKRGPNKELILHSVEDAASKQIQELIEKQRNQKQVLTSRNISPKKRIKTTTQCVNNREICADESSDESSVDGCHTSSDAQVLKGTKPTPASGSDVKPVSPLIMDKKVTAVGRGRGRGRGVLSPDAVTAVSCQSRGETPDTSGAETFVQDPSVSPSDSLVPVKFIKHWILKELRQTQYGLWAHEVPKLFEKNFNRKAPVDLLPRLQSWSDMIETEKLLRGPVLKLKRSIHQVPTREEKEADVATTSDVVYVKRTKEDTKLKWCTIPGEGRFLDVYIQWSKSPDDFCMVPCTMAKSLEKMIIELNDNFRSKPELSSTDSSLNPGKLCAGNIDGTWHRVVIQGRAKGENMFSIIVPDFCFETELPSDKLADLPSVFHGLPFCGIKARLFGVAPVDGNQWSDEVNEQFRLIVDKRNFVCLICEKDLDEDVVRVRLVDTTEDDDVIVDEILEARDLIRRV